VKSILARTDMLATSSLENLFENQKSREVDPDVVVVELVKVEVIVFEISEVDRRKSRRVMRKQQERRKRRVVLFLIIL